MLVQLLWSFGSMKAMVADGDLFNLYSMLVWLAVLIEIRWRRQRRLETVSLLVDLIKGHLPHRIGS